MKYRIGNHINNFNIQYINKDNKLIICVTPKCK